LLLHIGQSCGQLNLDSPSPQYVSPQYPVIPDRSCIA